MDDIPDSLFFSNEATAALDNVIAPQVSLAPCVLHMPTESQHIPRYRKYRQSKIASFVSMPFPGKTKHQFRHALIAFTSSASKLGQTLQISAPYANEGFERLRNYQAKGKSR